MDKTLLKIMKKAAVAGGEILMKQYNAEYSITKKGNNNNVSSVAIEAERMIIRIIENIFPTHTVLSKGCKVDKKSDYTWIVDALDGIDNYIRHIPMFGNSIALEYKQEMMMSIIYLPMTNELFYTFKGEGTYLNDKLLSKLIPLNKRSEELFITFSHGQRPEDLKKAMEYYNKIHPKVTDFRKLGASTTELTHVARGLIDGYIAPGLSIGNFKAATLMVIECGGSARTTKDGTVFVFAPGVEQILSKALV